jgi:hypothetical protein
MSAVLVLTACNDSDPDGSGGGAGGGMGSSACAFDAGPAPATGDGGADCPAEELFWCDLDAQSYDPLPILDGIDLADEVAPADPPTYWALRAGLETLAFGGEACADATDRMACEAKLESVESPPCGLVSCTHFLVVNRGDSVETIVDAPSALAFFGAIDRPMEAALLASVRGYEWIGPRPQGVRPTDSGYELVVNQLVSSCNPIVTDRILLDISSAGDVTEARRQHASVRCGFCA